MSLAFILTILFKYRILILELPSKTRKAQLKKKEIREK